MLSNIVTKLGAPEYIVSHGLGFVNNNVVINAGPITLNFTLSGIAQTVSGNTVLAEPVELDFRLEATLFYPPPIIVSSERINLNFRIQGTPDVENPTIVTADPIKLDFKLQATTFGMPGNIIFISPIRLNFRLTGETFGPDTFILDFEAHFNFTPLLVSRVNTKLTFLTPVELEEEFARVRIT